MHLTDEYKIREHMFPAAVGLVVTKLLSCGVWGGQAAVCEATRDPPEAHLLLGAGQQQAGPGHLHVQPPQQRGGDQHHHAPVHRITMFIHVIQQTLLSSVTFLCL